MHQVQNPSLLTIYCLPMVKPFYEQLFNLWGGVWTLVSVASRFIRNPVDLLVEKFVMSGPVCAVCTV